MTTETSYSKLRAIDVSAKIEKKNGLSYLSWPFAVDQLLLADPSATWTYAEPMRFGDTLMVFCTVTAFGKAMTSQLPVMDHRNKAIANPDAFAVNTAMQRCMVKAIALHGIGLSIYAGEDLPMEAGEAKHPEQNAHGTERAKFTKKVNEYALRITTAIEADNDHALTDVMHEVKDAGDEFRIAVWATLPTALKNVIKDKVPKAA